MFKSARDIRTEALARILAVRSDFSVLDGEPQTDIIDTLSIEVAKLFFFSDYLEKLTSISGLLSIVGDSTYKATLAQALGLSYTSLTLGPVLGVPSDIANDAEAILYYDINRIAGNYGLVRKPAEYATGIVRFYASSAAPLSVPIGTKVWTRGGTSLPFSTTVSISLVVPTLDPATGLYYIDVSIQSDQPGTVGNVASNTIQTLSPPVIGVVRITNLAATVGGKLRESNTDLLNRILNARSAICIDTRQGYESWAEAQTGVVDATVAGAGDDLMTRAPAGAVDIWIQGPLPDSITVTTQALNPGEEFVLPFQPVLGSFTVSGSVSLALTEGVGYSVVYDTAGGYARSVRAVTKIVFVAPVPVAGEIITVNYSYDKRVKDLQDALVDPTLEVPGADVLVKAGIQWFVISQMHVVPFPGYTQAEVESAVATALNSFLSTFRLGIQVDYSDFLVAAAQAAINNLQVVDRIEGLVIGRDLESNPFPLPTLSNVDLSADDNEYYSLGQIIFV